MPQVEALPDTVEHGDNLPTDGGPDQPLTDQQQVEAEDEQVDETQTPESERTKDEQPDEQAEDGTPEGTPEAKDEEGGEEAEPDVFGDGFDPASLSEITDPQQLTAAYKFFREESARRIAKAEADAKEIERASHARFREAAAMRQALGEPSKPESQGPTEAMGTQPIPEVNPDELADMPADKLAGIINGLAKQVNHLQQSWTSEKEQTRQQQERTQRATQTWQAFCQSEGIAPDSDTYQEMMTEAKTLDSNLVVGDIVDPARCYLRVMRNRQSRQGKQVVTDQIRRGSAARSVATTSPGRTVPKPQYDPRRAKSLDEIVAHNLGG